MSTITPAAAYWTAVLAETGASARADAVAALLTTGTKLKFYDSGGSLIRTVTSAAWAKGALTQSHYPITPGAFTGSQTGNGTPATVVVTSSADVEIFRTTAGVLSGVFSIPSAFATSVDLVAGSFKLKYPSPTTAPTGKRWHPGHYLMVCDASARTGMVDSVRNLVRYDANWQGYHGEYWWNRLESTQGVYDFSIITDDLDKAQADGKMMWVQLMNRSFHGTSRGAFCPAYITNAGWTYAYTGGGQNFIGCKMWVAGCGEAWLDMVDACLAAISAHPALAGVNTEEGAQSGSWLESGYTWQAMNEFVLEQSLRGSAGIGDALWHNCMGWSNEPSGDTTEHYRMTDTVVRSHRVGLAPRDLAMSSYAAWNANDYGQYIFDRYAGEAYFYGCMDWIAYFNPEMPRTLIDNAIALGVNFIYWHPMYAGAGATFTTADVIAELNRRGGSLNDTPPSIITALDPPSASIADDDSRFVWSVDPKKTFSGVGSAYAVSRQVTDLAPSTWPTGVPANDSTHQLFDRVLNPDSTGEYVYKHRISSDRAYGNQYGGFAAYNQTWRSEFTNDTGLIDWGQEYWIAFAVYLDSDMSAAEPSVSIFDLHSPWQTTQPVAVSPVSLMYGGGTLGFYVRWNTSIPGNSNDYNGNTLWSDASPTLNTWLYFVLRLRVGPDGQSFATLYHKEGAGSLSQVGSYSGPIGFAHADGSGYNYVYPKHGLYSWTYTWPVGGSASASRTIYTKGMHILNDDAGTPTLDAATVLTLITGA